MIKEVKSYLNTRDAVIYDNGGYSIQTRYLLAGDTMSISYPATKEETMKLCFTESISFISLFSSIFSKKVDPFRFELAPENNYKVTHIYTAKSDTIALFYDMGEIIRNYDKLKELKKAYPKKLLILPHRGKEND